jgi:hypothetical protein
MIFWFEWPEVGRLCRIKVEIIELVNFHMLMLPRFGLFMDISELTEGQKLVKVFVVDYRDTHPLAVMMPPDY